MRGRLTATTKVEKQRCVGLPGTLTRSQDVSERVVFRHEERDVVKSANAWVWVNLTAVFKTSDEDTILDVTITHYALGNHKVSDINDEL